MKSPFYLLCVLVLAAACSKGRPTPPPADHFVAPADSPYFKNAEVPAARGEDCRARIERIVCLVDPMPPVEDGQDQKPRECVAGVDLAPAVEALQNIYDAYPKALASVFCSLGRVYLEREFFATAYAGSDESGTQAVMGFRAELLLDRPLKPLAEWITWKEQLNFGGNPKDYATREDLVRIEAKIETESGANDFLFYVIAHEFGHILDFKYKANRFDCPAGKPDGAVECPAVAGSWSALSWTSIIRGLKADPTDPWGLRESVPNATAQFEHRDELCFYACAETHGTPERMFPLYQGLQRSSFLTTYSATNPADDFAEGVAFYAGTLAKDLTYAAVLPGGARFDLAQKFREAPEYAAKRAWLESFFASIER